MYIESPESRPRDGVGADVALKVQQRATTDPSIWNKRSKYRQVILHNPGDGFRVGQKAFDVIHFGSGVDVGSVIPVRPVSG
jgi:hypothetical protein